MHAQIILNGSSATSRELEIEFSILGRIYDAHNAFWVAYMMYTMHSGSHIRCTQFILGCIYDAAQLITLRIQISYLVDHVICVYILFPGSSRDLCLWFVFWLITWSIFAFCFMLDYLFYLWVLFSGGHVIMFVFRFRKKLKSFSCLFLLLNPSSKLSRKVLFCILVRICATHGTFWILWLWSRGKSQICCYLESSSSNHVTIFIHSHITIFVLRTALMFQFVLIAISIAFQLIFLLKKFNFSFHNSSRLRYEVREYQNIRLLAPKDNVDILPFLFASLLSLKFLRKRKNDPCLKVIFTRAAFFFCTPYKPSKPQNKLKSCFTCQFFTKDTIKKTRQINTFCFLSEPTISALFKFSSKIDNSFCLPWLLLSGDISLNPGPFSNPQLFKQGEWQAFNNRGIHLTRVNINSLLPKIDKLRYIAKRTKAAVISIYQNLNLIAQVLIQKFTLKITKFFVLIEIGT